MNTERAGEVWFSPDGAELVIEGVRDPGPFKDPQPWVSYEWRKNGWFMRFVTPVDEFERVNTPEGVESDEAWVRTALNEVIDA